MSAAIVVEGISKLYRIGAQTARYATLRDALSNRFRRDRGTGDQAIREFWALRDVSFDAKEGAVLGVIGRNGAGKSTLLKILARVTAPTRGRARMRGRVGCMLEVGTGFHPELTGRDNVFLNGSILGMERARIVRVFDEIVEFAGLARFIDTPVKHYSSGMQVRLAFAVAAFIDVDILLIDEVLAVGDAEFQKRSLAKVDDIASGGRTVLFVSHHMPTIARLASETLWLDGGTIAGLGPTNDVVGRYLQAGSQLAGERIWSDYGSQFQARPRSLRISQSGGGTTGVVDSRAPFTIDVEYEIAAELPSHRIALTLSAADGTPVLTSLDTPIGKRLSPGLYTSTCEVPGGFLNDGQYRVSFTADVPSVEDLYTETDVLTITIEDLGRSTDHGSERWPGLIRPHFEWRISSAVPAV